MKHETEEVRRSGDYQGRTGRRAWLAGDYSKLEISIAGSQIGRLGAPRPEKPEVKMPDQSENETVKL